jgi:hypothetical protein
MTIAFEVGLSSSFTDFFHFENKTVNAAFISLLLNHPLLMAAWSGL